MPDFRWIPSVDSMLRQLPESSLPRPMVVSIIRRELELLRSASAEVSPITILETAVAAVRRVERLRIQPVINATGVILHTNLGRAPFGDAVADAVRLAATHYCSLEFDLNTGERGPRAAYVEQALALLCSAPAATVVNNCAAALMLIIRRLTAGTRKHVIISRGELIQIGGGFRVPEILEASGAILREVGTTNQTDLADYRRAIGDDVALILKVHRSNFFMDGFVSSPTTAELAMVARESAVPLVEDIGSGATFDTTTLDPAITTREPTPGSTLAAGANLVCFSGDKLLGGPQAGIIAGDSALVAALKRDPIFRALRCDKLVLTALQASTDALLAGNEANVASRKLMMVSTADLKHRAKAIVAASPSSNLQIIDSRARVGGGSMPQAILESVSLALPAVASSPILLRQLRENEPPIIAKIDHDRVLLDLRTVFPTQDDLLIAAIARLTQRCLPTST